MVYIHMMWLLKIMFQEIFINTKKLHIIKFMFTL